jgi:hypothetical protein
MPHCAPRETLTKQRLAPWIALIVEASILWFHEFTPVAKESSTRGPCCSRRNIMAEMFMGTNLMLTANRIEQH